MELNKNIINQIQSIIANTKEKAIRSVDTERVLMYWEIGKVIFEEEQAGKDRADYGKFLIKSISNEFQSQFGSGFTVRQLEMNRQFYRTFPNTNALRSQFNWTHYKLLLSVDNHDKREFYIAETTKNNWTARQLERQINSQLFERLLLSNDVQSVLEVAREEKLPIDAKEIIKDPMILEFLGLKREAAYYEKDLETAIITHLQDFLLEIGNGFSFVARQKRIHIEGDEFFIDLVFYNRLLQCFVLIEIKTDKLTHQDIGQLQMYVNYYDRFEKQEHENQSIGILLCADKNDAMVKITLPENNKTIIGSKYQLYLPTEQHVLEVAREEKLPTEAKEIIKDPMILGFLGLKQEAAYYEKDLETAIITHLQDFLLEMGNGFSFVARQKRIHIEGDEFFIDLVFYNRLLQCFVLIEIKTDKLTHQDIGQLQMYVNYYDRFEKQEHKNQSIGILVCADKNDAMVKITLPENNKTIIASKYQLYLPTEQQLIDEVMKEIEKLDQNRSES